MIEEKMINFELKNQRLEVINDFFLICLKIIYPKMKFKEEGN